MLHLSTTILTLILPALLSLANPISTSPPSLSLITSREYYSEVVEFLYGNQEWRKEVSDGKNPHLLKSLTVMGQKPKAWVTSCSDSRVPIDVIAKSDPGTWFGHRNIANQYHESDHGATAVLAYAMEELDVTTYVVLGHYGCGGVAGAIASPPKELDEGMKRVGEWISPIAELWKTSTRPEIVKERAYYEKKGGEIPHPEYHNPAFKALVEENVKAQVQHIAHDPMVVHAWEEYEHDPVAHKPVRIFGLVYDLETGELKDLGVTMGPPGKH